MRRCDGFNGILPHINAKAAFAVVAKPPAADLAALRKKKGWSFTYLSSANNTFNLDLAVEPTAEVSFCVVIEC